MRSSSDQTPSPGGQTGARSPTHNPGFQALSKIRKSLREKRPGSGPRRQLTVEDVSRELVSVRDDLQVCHCPELRELSSDKKSATPGNIPKPILFVSPVILKKIHEEIFAPICSQ